MLGPAVARKLTKRLELSGRKALRAALRAALPKPVPTGDPDPAAVRRVLVIRQDNRIGNLVLVTPLIEGIRAAWPQASVDVLTSDAFPEVYDGNPSLRRVIAAPKKAFIGHPLRFLSFFRMLRNERYDVAFDCSHMHEFSLSSGAAARLTAATVRVGYARGDADLYLTRLVELAPEGTHEMEIHLRLLRAIAPGAALEPAAALAPRWTISSEEARRAAQRWEEWGITEGRAVGVFLGGRGPKRWPAERFAAIARAAVAAGHPVVFFGGPAERDALAALPKVEGSTIAAPLPLREFAATMRGCRAVVTADTGPMHVAVAVGVPTVAIFSASEPERYGYAHLPEHCVVGRKGVDVGVGEVKAALEGLLSGAARAGSRS